MVAIYCIIDPESRGIILYWKKYFTMITEITCNLFQYLWYNQNIQIDKNSIYFLRFSEKISFMFHNFLFTMRPLQNGINLRKDMIYMKSIAISGYRKTDIYY